jgi:hypothetical protein
MATVSEIAEAVLSTLAAGLPDVEVASSVSYLAAVQSSTIALISVAQGHQDEGMYYSQGWIHGVHRLRFEFWVKIVQGDEDEYMPRTRDIGYEAMKVLVREDGNGYLLAPMGSGVTLTSQVEERPIAAGGIPYLVVMLGVPVMQKEVV